VAVGVAVRVEEGQGDAFGPGLEGCRP